MNIVYRGMDRAGLDTAYDNRGAVADSERFLARWWEASAAVRAEPRSRTDLRYGARPRASFDYFPSGAADAPLFVFIHGGYWQRNEKERFAFLARGPRAHGINVAVPGYTLAPQARLTDIVAEIRQAIGLLAERAQELGFDRDRIIVGGWSAGGHLTAAVADHPAARGGIPISGIFDLEPIALGGLNDKLQLNREEIATLSPLKTVGTHRRPLRIFVGGAELPELKRQSQDYAAACHAHGMPVELAVLPGRNHFSILGELEAADGLITRTLVELVRSASA